MQAEEALLSFSQSETFLLVGKFSSKNTKFLAEYSILGNVRGKIELSLSRHNALLEICNVGRGKLELPASLLLS